MHRFGPAETLAQTPIFPKISALLITLILAFSIGAPFQGKAQELGQIISPILVVDRERMFAESAFGQSIQTQIDDALTILEAESLAIVVELEAEELKLSTLRGSLPAAEFRALAAAFDTKVEEVRQERVLAEEDHLAKSEGARIGFLEQINPVLAELMQNAGATVLLEKRAAIISANSIDITTAAIRRIDELFIKGSEPTEPTGEPDNLAPVDGSE